MLTSPAWLVPSAKMLRNAHPRCDIEEAAAVSGACSAGALKAAEGPWYPVLSQPLPVMWQLLYFGLKADTNVAAGTCRHRCMLKFSCPNQLP
jgi:hypothetical protein